MWIPDEDPHRHQQLGDKSQHAVRVSTMARAGEAAPNAVRRQRPDTDQCKQQHHRFEQSVDRAVRHQDGGDGIAEAGRRDVRCRLRRQCRRGLGQQQHDRRKPRRYQRAEHQRPQTAGLRPGFSPASRRHGAAQAGACAQQQCRRLPRCRSPPRSALHPAPPGAPRPAPAAAHRRQSRSTAANVSRAAIGPDGHSEDQ